jgi:hypothetical protein
MARMCLCIALLSFCEVGCHIIQPTCWLRPLHSFVRVIELNASTRISILVIVRS